LKVLVTGGMGYIGSHMVIELLKSKKFKVISADSCERSTPETASRIELITGEKVMNYPVDILQLINRYLSRLPSRCFITEIICKFWKMF
jgi:UDP-glucose 4-epimerase